jgi:hypothetical protein
MKWKLSGRSVHLETSLLLSIEHAGAAALERSLHDETNNKLSRHSVVQFLGIPQYLNKPSSDSDVTDATSGWHHQARQQVSLRSWSVCAL